jgi:hypothetical protein
VRGIGKNNFSRPESVIDWILGRQSSGLFPKGHVVFLDLGSTRIVKGTFRIFEGSPLRDIATVSL